jgi:alpha-tubulin suppressor-like RCC1 family protein
MRKLALLIVVVLTVALAGANAAAAVSPGSVSAWGDNSNGQLGNGANLDHPSAVTTQGVGNVVEVSAGEAFSMALTASGSVFAWGDNEFGDFGVVTPHPSAILPVQVTALSGVKQVVASFDSGHALLSNGTVLGWGANGHGDVGDGTTTARPTPVRVTGLSGVVAIAGRHEHALALLSNGTVMQWGQRPGPDQLTPTPVPGLSNVVAIAAGDFHDLALLANGTVMTWGSGGNGALGNGSFNDQLTPVPVTGVTNAVGISAGTFFSLVLLGNGAVVGFGSNQYNQLGPAAPIKYDTPIAVAGVGGVTQVAAGDSFSAALLADGSAIAWGSNAHGSIGDGTIGATFSTVPTPTPVVGIVGARAISAGGAHTLAITAPVAPPPPVLGSSVDVTPVSGTVLVKLKGQGFVPLTLARRIPVGSVLDTTRGVVALTSAGAHAGKLQTGQFRSGRFQVMQARGQQGLTTLRLVDSSGLCAAAGKATIARRLPHRVTDLLRADVKGNFNTTGRYSAATVRGTAWDTSDRCDGTLTVVHRGVVQVRDFRRRKTVVLRAGQSYLAKAA